MKKSEFIERYGLEAYQRQLEKCKRYNQRNKERIQQYYRVHKTEIADYNKQYYQTPKGRAVNLVNHYKRLDKKYNRGECALTSKWVLDNIFTSKCIYCGESDWRKLGCDRIDNSLPHTEDNVVCCCGKCNVERQKTNFDEFLKIKRVV